MQDHFFDLAAVLHCLEPCAILPVAPEDCNRSTKVIVLVSDFAGETRSARWRTKGDDRSYRLSSPFAMARNFASSVFIAFSLYLVFAVSLCERPTVSLRLARKLVGNPNPSCVRLLDMEAGSERVVGIGRATTSFACRISSCKALRGEESASFASYHCSGTYAALRTSSLFERVFSYCLGVTMFRYSRQSWSRHTA